MSRKTYELADNALGVRSLSFMFEGDTCVLTLRTVAETRAITCGVGRWEKGQDAAPLVPPNASLLAPNSPKAAAAGVWTDDHTFVMTLQLVETPFRDTVTSVFEGDGVRVTFACGVGNTTFEQDARPVLTGRIAP